MTKKKESLQGINVFDLTRVLAGPTATQILGDLGANIIKVERPITGDDSRNLGPPYLDSNATDPKESAYYLSVNRNKHSVTIDLTKKKGQVLAKKIIKKCDVLVENFRAGNLKQYGLDYKSIKKINPKIIYVAVTGFGQVGPRRDQPATDSVMQAYTGMMSINRDINGLPQRINMLAIDFSAGLYSFQAAASALYGQAVKGKGKLIETSLLEAAMVFQEAALIESYLQEGKPEPIGMPVGSFKTKDGFMSINARRDSQFKSFCTLIGREEWISDSRFIGPRERVANCEILMSQIRPIIETKTSDEWNELLSDADILNAKVHTHMDLLNDPQVQAAKAICWVENDTLGNIPMASIPGQPMPIAGDKLSHSPHVGEHNQEILTELGYSTSDIKNFKNEGVIGTFTT